MNSMLFRLSPGEAITIASLTVLIAALAVALEAMITLSQYDKEDEFLYDDD